MFVSLMCWAVGWIMAARVRSVWLALAGCVVGSVLLSLAAAAFKYTLLPGRFTESELGVAASLSAAMGTLIAIAGFATHRRKSSNQGHTGSRLRQFLVARSADEAFRATPHREFGRTDKVFLVLIVGWLMVIGTLAAFDFHELMDDRVMRIEHDSGVQFKVRFSAAQEIRVAFDEFLIHHGDSIDENPSAYEETTFDEPYRLYVDSHKRHMQVKYLKLAVLPSLMLSIIWVGFRWTTKSSKTP